MSNEIIDQAPEPFPPFWSVGWGKDQWGYSSDLGLSPEGGDSMPMRWVFPGTFKMGSPQDENGRLDTEGPRNEVWITEGFWMGTAQCSRKQWFTIMDPGNKDITDPDLPMTHISWHDCMEFCDRLTLIIPPLRPRLPSEAQWEYACRGGTDSAFNNGAPCTEPKGEDPALNQLGWYNKNSKGKTHPYWNNGKPLKPNAFGLYDMHGNLYEWCSDFCGEYVKINKAVVDPEGPEYEGEGRDSLISRVARGGCFRHAAGNSRSASRAGFNPGNRDFDGVGFRLVVKASYGDYPYDNQLFWSKDK